MQANASSGQDVQYLTVRSLAERLEVGERTVRLWLAETDIPHRRVGGVIRFVLAEVDEWMKAQTPESTKASEPAA